jgi:hypothetical protein
MRLMALHDTMLGPDNHSGVVFLWGFSNSGEQEA